MLVCFNLETSLSKLFSCRSKSKVSRSHGRLAQSSLVFQLQYSLYFDRDLVKIALFAFQWPSNFQCQHEFPARPENRCASSLVIFSANKDLLISICRSSSSSAFCFSRILFAFSFPNHQRLDQFAGQNIRVTFSFARVCRVHFCTSVANIQLFLEYRYFLLLLSYHLQVSVYLIFSKSNVRIVFGSCCPAR